MTLARKALTAAEWTAPGTDCYLGPVMQKRRSCAAEHVTAACDTRDGSILRGESDGPPGAPRASPLQVGRARWNLRC